MTSPVTLSDNHVFLSSEKDIQSIYLDQLGSHGVRYFEYLRVYDDGSSIILASNQKVIRYVFDHEIPIIAPIQQQYIKDKFQYFILPSGSYIKAVHDIKNDFNLSNFFNMVERHNGYIDLYCFGADTDNTDIINFYLNKIDVLDRFKEYFKEKSGDLIKNSMKSRIRLPETMLPPYKGLLTNSSRSSQEFQLSERQTECLHFLIRGMTIKEIARRLGLSPRTVEHYLETVKIKMDCNSRSELFDKARQLKIIHEQWQ